MTVTYTPPPRATAFIAYQQQSVDSPDEHGQVQSFRAQVFVREFPSIKVKGHRTKTLTGHGGVPFATTSFTFDAESASIPDFRHDFTASLAASDPVHDLLVRAEREAEPVAIVVETSRRAKTGAGAAIDPHTPIHVLRGAHPDGSKADSSLTGAHCKNVVAAAGISAQAGAVRVAAEAVSAPDEWSDLRRNRLGDWAPTGWQPGDGGIVTAEPTGDGARRSWQAAAQSPRPWDVRDHSGRVNAGGYLVSKDRAVFVYAWRKVVEIGYTAEPVDAAARRLCDVLAWIADHVHDRVVAGHVLHDRVAKSHAEADRWVTFVIDEIGTVEAGYALASAHLADKDAGRAWAKLVTDRAASLFAMSVASVEGYLEGASTPTSKATPMADSLSEAYLAFLGRVVDWGPEHPHRFAPVLDAEFGGHDLVSIPLDRFAARLRQWDRTERTRAAFYTAAAAHAAPATA